MNWLDTSTGHHAAYQLNAANTALTLWSPSEAWQDGGQNLFRHKDAFYFLPSESEWYKAAFYDSNKGGPGVGGYWIYPTGSDTAPVSVASGTAQGTAVYDRIFQNPSGPAPVDLAGGLSPYGTRGQGGNANQFTETEYDGTNDNPSGYRAVRGAVADQSTAAQLQSSSRSLNLLPDAYDLSFRVASVPEPSAAVLMLSAGMVAAVKRRRRTVL